jgi:hypothetical protein
MRYLQLGLNDSIDIEMNTQFILTEIINKHDHHLRLLCLILSTADDKMVQRLQKMLNHGKLLCHYTIKRVLDRIYINCSL